MTDASPVRNIRAARTGLARSTKQSLVEPARISIVHYPRSVDVKGDYGVMWVRAWGGREAPAKSRCGEEEEVRGAA